MKGVLNYLFRNGSYTPFCIYLEVNRLFLHDLIQHVIISGNIVRSKDVISERIFQCLILDTKIQKIQNLFPTKNRLHQ